MSELQVWNRLAETAHEMAATAKAHDWDALIATYARFQDILAGLPRSIDPQLSITERTDKARAIRSILADYQAVRDHVGPWMADLKPLLDAWNETVTQA